MGQRARAAVLGATTVGLHLALGLAMRAPIIHSDELGYLSGARYIAGRGLAPQTQYFPAYSLLLAPVARVADSTLALW
ncbi:MAG: hypothetical protein ACRDZW_10465, partial [Acidimicrobiales bacterium]